MSEQKLATSDDVHCWGYSIMSVILSTSGEGEVKWLVMAALCLLMAIAVKWKAK